MNRTELQRRLDEIGVPRNYYCLKGFDVPYGFIEGYVLEGNKNQWISYLIDEKGLKNNKRIFENEDESCDYFYSIVKEYWSAGKNYWHYEQSVQVLLNAFHDSSLIHRWLKRFFYKWKSYPIYTDLNGLISFVKKKHTDAIITIDGSNKTIIALNVHTIIIHKQNNKWYVVNMINNKICGLVFLECVADVCVVVCYYLYHENCYIQYIKSIM